MEHKDQYWDSKCNHTPTEVLANVAQYVVCHILRSAFSPMPFILVNQNVACFYCFTHVTKRLTGTILDVGWK